MTAKRDTAQNQSVADCNGKEKALETVAKPKPPAKRGGHKRQAEELPAIAPPEALGEIDLAAWFSQDDPDNPMTAEHYREARALLEWAYGSEDRFSFTAFAASRGYSNNRLTEYRQNSQGFHEAFCHCRDIFRDRLIGGGLTQRFSGRLAEFILKTQYGLNESSTLNVHVRRVDPHQIDQSTLSDLAHHGRISVVNQRLQDQRKTPLPSIVDVPKKGVK